MASIDTIRAQMTKPFALVDGAGRIVMESADEDHMLRWCASQTSDGYRVVSRKPKAYVSRPAVDPETGDTW